MKNIQKNKGNLLLLGGGGGDSKLGGGGGGGGGNFPPLKALKKILMTHISLVPLKGQIMTIIAHLALL